MQNWQSAAIAAIQSATPAALVSIVGVQGSSPREVGAKMLVTMDRARGSVGGGMLEHMAIQRARRMLKLNEREAFFLDLPLGPDLNQCCGGVVVLFFEPLDATDLGWLQALDASLLNQGVLLTTRLDATRAKALLDCNGKHLAGEPVDLIQGTETHLATDNEVCWLAEPLHTPRMHISLFGAGHVGRALIYALAPHQCDVLWIDSRPHEFPEHIPDNVTVRHDADIEPVCAELPENDHVLVITHRHTLDYEIVRHLLARNDFSFLGLIGSAAKRQRFERSLRKEGVNDDTLKRLTCPIGLPGITGKGPEIIATSVVAQLLQHTDQNTPAHGTAGLQPDDPLLKPYRGGML